MFKLSPLLAKTHKVLEGRKQRKIGWKSCRPVIERRFYIFGFMIGFIQYAGTMKLAVFFWKLAFIASADYISRKYINNEVWY